MGKIGYGIQRVQIRGTGTGLWNRLLRRARRAFMRKVSPLPGKVASEGK
jgi:hypothetical protein